ncbi:hypothetical protein COT97_04620 [Candidatus Falkowbacteria bacterium CG10_big_fil_rev_8_21_14_0_10_39_11]|uniref:Type II secretion system protein GspF domain-containing protein n=1 Tax=Candidatus Falkowbacteria bacterium CG10_big_fil_rev_8_21_14_0_10_39_11 TaxID=1974565 RepID=A0A2H0V649_9BACT|nr:MAG: hypothetical protein COT97_04620 [Candidatus Falkowbacteria bacterium CG10_big_fil_rev_8_21_14_0_10_39_11]
MAKAKSKKVTIKKKNQKKAKSSLKILKFLERAVRPLLNFGIGEDKMYFVENLSMLLAASIDIETVLRALRPEIKTRRMQTLVDRMIIQVGEGMPIWKALNESHIFPAYVIALLRLGEESGTLSQNLNSIALQEQNDKMFKSKIRSAMLYPVFVLGLTFIIGLGVAWFILPRLSTVFKSLKVDLPFITRVFMNIGEFFRLYGSIAVPSIIITFILIIYFVFFFPKTKIIGQAILFQVPGVSTLIKELELARMGYIMGSLLEASLPINEALSSLQTSASHYRFRKLYSALTLGITDGESFQQVFLDFKKSRKLIPTSIQQMIISSERSGNLPETFIKIGENFEARTENTTKNLAVVLEPILLVIVWLGVLFVALAVILPIYGLVGNFNRV